MSSRHLPFKVYMRDWDTAPKFELIATFRSHTDANLFVVTEISGRGDDAEFTIREGKDIIQRLDSRRIEESYDE